MNVVGKVRSLISQSVYSVATPFHPFSGAVDVIVVEQEDGSFCSTPWYVRFGKFQGVLKGAKKIVRISVNGVEASFHMYLDNSGKAYFIREVVSSKDNDKEAVVNESDSLEIIREDNDYYNGDSVSLCRNEINVCNADDVQFSDERVSLSTDEIENDEADNERQFCEFQEYQCSRVDSVGSLGYGAFGYDSKGSYLTWEKASPIVLGMAAFGLDLPIEPKDAISVEQDETPKPGEDARGITTTTSSHQWRLWPIPFRTFKTLQHTSSNSSNEDLFLDSESGLQNPRVDSTPMSNAGCESPHKQLVRTNIPTTEQIASLNLKDGQNMITFSFSTRVLGTQQVDAHVYLWKWNARVVISDVDGTITKSDVRGQFMPLVGKDWTQSGVAQLFSAIRENGYQLLFLSARAIVQAYLTRSFLLNLKQDGKALPKGPIVISPDGLFSSLYREVIRRAPHEFKIACLEDIKALFPSGYNPFYAGFGNRDTDKLSYMKIGIPEGKIFIINPKGEVAISHSIDVMTYMSLHTRVNNMFPPTSLVEQEDFNS